MDALRSIDCKSKPSSPAWAGKGFAMTDVIRDGEGVHIDPIHAGAGGGRSRHHVPASEDGEGAGSEGGRGQGKNVPDYFQDGEQSEEACSYPVP